MIPRLLIDTADIPHGGQLCLYRRGDAFSIMLGGNELMNSRLSGSEEALATLAIDRIGLRRDPVVLIGGLGMGFTLRAALSKLGGDARLIVAELVPAVIGWATGPLAEVFGDSMADPRVAIHRGDVAALIEPARAAYDAILLDVDNGPDGLTAAANDRLYAADGLTAARTALRPGGVLAIWSAHVDQRFAQRLRSADLDVEEVVVRAHRDRGARHIIWLATRPDDRAGPPLS